MVHGRIQLSEARFGLKKKKRENQQKVGLNEVTDRLMNGCISELLSGKAVY